MFALQYEKLTLLKYLLKLNWNLGILIFGEGGNLEKNPQSIKKQQRFLTELTFCFTETEGTRPKPLLFPDISLWS